MSLHVVRTQGTPLKRLESSSSGACHRIAPLPLKDGPTMEVAWESIILARPKSASIGLPDLVTSTFA